MGGSVFFDYAQVDIEVHFLVGPILVGSPYLHGVALSSAYIGYLDREEQFPVGPIEKTGKHSKVLNMPIRRSARHYIGRRKSLVEPNQFHGGIDIEQLQLFVYFRVDGHHFMESFPHRSGLYFGLLSSP